MSDNGFWNNDWMALQQQYWKGWSEINRKAMGIQEPPKSPWEQAMEHWWEAVSPAMPDAAGGFMRKMLAQGQNFFHMAEEFAGKLPAQAGAEEWGDALTRLLNDLQSTFSGVLHGQGDDALHKMMAFWEMPLDNWQRMVSSLSLVPGDTLRNMPHGDPGEQLKRFLSAPGLGYTREEQGQQQQMLLLLVEYQTALQEYMQFFSSLGVASVDRMRQRLQKVAQEGSTIDSARALNDLWVNACEEVYGEQVMTPEYARIHGRLVNALMAVKHHMGVMVDETLGTFNMPTRAELRTLQTRMQENRREIKQLGAELASLKAELAQLGKTRTATKKKSAARKRPAKKTSAGKK